MTIFSDIIKPPASGRQEVAVIPIPLTSLASLTGLDLKVFKLSPLVRLLHYSRETVGEQGIFSPILNKVL
jgi:hypothetical protein